MKITKTKNGEKAGHLQRTLHHLLEEGECPYPDGAYTWYSPDSITIKHYKNRRTAIKKITEAGYSIDLPLNQRKGK